MTFTARLLGAAQIETADGVLVPMERKAAALLAYLALEGPTRRAQLAELLWPETREAAARNNLVHLLRKLRQLGGQELVQGAEVLSLNPELGVDAVVVRDLFMRGELAHLAHLDGELLQGLTYDDCPGLDDWVLAERERWGMWRADALREKSAVLQREGQWDEALRWAKVLLDLDPVSEDAHRRVMRLHYLRGDRPAALRAYHRCEQTLRRELDLAPLPETVELARSIEQGTLAAATPVRARAELPLSVLRPPHLVGREREWARMEQAWQAGQWIFISGEPGSGKTRLAFDFAASKGSYTVFAGRPGDRVQPWATLTRMAREYLGRLPDPPIEPWARRELSRLLPDLVPPGGTPPPITGEEDLLRFRQAYMAFAMAAHLGMPATVSDDWQFYDDSTNQMGMYMFGTSFPLGQPGGMPRILVTFRRGELPPESQALLRHTLDSGMAVFIDLEPLDERAVASLLGDLRVPADPAACARLWRHSGGNPHFLLETVKLLLEAGRLGGGLPDPLPLPEKVLHVIGRRLEALSPPALQAARAAAVLQSDFDPEQVAELLHAPLLELALAWEELEAAQVLHGNRFAHDLVYEAVLAGIPGSVRQLLHRAAARTLERHGAGAARVARHWMQGGKAGAAVPFLQRAAREAQDQYRLEEAADFYGEAAALLQSLGDPAASLALSARIQVLSLTSYG